MTQGPTVGETRKGSPLKDPRGFLQLAEEHRRRGRHKEAIAVCLEGLALHPHLDAARVTLGRSYLESKQIEAARDTLQEVFTRLPEHHLAGKLLAEARMRLGDLAGAAATCREILRAYPRDREVEALLSEVESQSAPSAGPASDPKPDFLPEDVGSAPATALASGPVAAVASAPATAATSVPASAAVSAPVPSPLPAAAPPPPATPSIAAGWHHTPPLVRPAPGPLPAAVPKAPPRDELQTNTLAELYLKQGLTERALEVYRGMLRQDPGNERLHVRIRELEDKKAAAAPPAPPAVPASVPSAAAPRPVAPMPTAASTWGTPAASPLAPPERPEAPTPRNVEAIDRLARWLDAIRSGSEPASPRRASR